MKKKSLLTWLVVLALVFCAVSIQAVADDGKLIDWSQYDLDQLLQIREELDEEIYARKVAFAKEYGNRIIDVGDEKVTLFVGRTHTPEVSIERVLDESPETTNLLWSSSDETIANVDVNGKITGISSGNAFITCQAEDDEFIRASIDVQVVLPVERVTIPDAIDILIREDGEKTEPIKLDASIEPENAFNPTLAWESSDESVALIDDGFVTAVGPGTAIITAKAADGFSEQPVNAVCVVTVKMSVSSIEVETEDVTIEKNNIYSAKHTVLPENATQKTVSWESANPEIASVSANGQITGRTCGTTKIICKATDGSGVSREITVSVVQKVMGLRWEDYSQIQLNVNESVLLGVSVAPEDATNKTLKWTSDNNSIVTVTDSGKIKAVGSGTTRVTCTTTDGSEQSISRDIFVPSICVSANEYTIKEKSGLKFSFDYYGKQSDFTWTLSNSSLCDVDMSASGTKVNVTLMPKKAGTFVITLNDATSYGSRTNITVTVDHSAAYDTFSYPVGDYSGILRNPGSYKGNQISIYGRVLQKQTSFWGTTVLRVGTGGYGYYDNVFYITYKTSDIDINVIEDDYVTVYGKCTGTETYTTILGGSITIPAMDAEKIILGRN